MNNLISLPIPVICPSDNGFDIIWRETTFEHNINIPHDLNQLIEIYGEKRGSPQHYIEVHIKYNLLESTLELWLKKILNI